MQIIEDSSIGIGRQMALQEVGVRLNFGGGDPSMPDYREVTARLGKIASDSTADLELRYQLLPVLFQHDDPNDWLDTAMKFSVSETEAVMKGEKLQRMAPSRYSGKLTAANRAKYLTLAFALLEAMDDGHSGTGYGLAEDIGQVIAIPQGWTGQGIFRPAVDRPEFHKDGSLTEVFFQFPADNALSWWRQHRKEYAIEVVPGDHSDQILRPRKPRHWISPGSADKGSNLFASEYKWRMTWAPIFAVAAAIIVYRFMRKARIAS